MEVVKPLKEVKVRKVTLFPFFLIFTALNILFNLLGLPYVKVAFLGQTILLAIMIVTSGQKLSFWAMVIFSLFEGQGRVIMGYNILFRLLFDILIGLLVIRAVIGQKKLINREVIPNYLTIGIFLHFVWFILELFNPNGAGMIPGLVTSKIYIFPFLLFFYFQNLSIDFMEDKEQKFILLFCIILFFSALIVLAQAQSDESFIYGISMNYSNLFAKYKNFTGNVYRPWGTSFGPGGMGPLFFQTLPFVLLFKPRAIFPKSPPAYASLVLLKWTTFAVLAFASFVGQVRSATLKFFLVFAFFIACKFLGSKLKFKKVVFALSFVLIGTLTLPFTSKVLESSNISIDGAVARYEGLVESGGLANRATFDLFMNLFEERVEFPFGYGVGMTAGFLPDFEERRKKHVNIPKHWFWSHDNLFLFLFLELGVGAFIYLFILFSVNLSLISRWITLLRWKELTAFSVLSSCAITVFVITVFNWGAVGIPFNPESFFFWFWAGMGFNIYKLTKDKRASQLTKEEVEDIGFDSFEEKTT
jgi:hypothetical protein